MNIGGYYKCENVSSLSTYTFWQNKTLLKFDDNAGVYCVCALFEYLILFRVYTKIIH